MFEPLNSQFSFFLLFRTLVGEKYCYRVQNIVLFQNLDQGVLEPNKFLTFLVHVVVSVRYVVRHRYRYLMQKFVNKIQTKREFCSNFGIISHPHGNCKFMELTGSLNFLT